MRESGGEHQAPGPSQSSSQHNTTNLGAMEDKLAALKSLGEGGQFTHQKGC
jgi:hypothetical protein